MKKMLMVLAIAVMAMLSLPAFASSLDDGYSGAVFSGYADLTVPTDVHADVDAAAINAGPGDDDDDPEYRHLSHAPGDAEDDYDRLRDRPMSARVPSMTSRDTPTERSTYGRT